MPVPLAWLSGVAWQSARALDEESHCPPISTNPRPSKYEDFEIWHPLVIEVYSKKTSATKKYMISTELVHLLVSEDQHGWLDPMAMFQAIAKQTHWPNVL